MRTNVSGHPALSYVESGSEPLGHDLHVRQYNWQVERIERVANRAPIRLFN